MWNRDEAVNALIADDINTIESDSGWYLSAILSVGFKGYDNYADDELIQELMERDISTVFGDNDDEL